MEESVVIVYGDPFEGLTLVGPFEGTEAARTYAEDNSPGKPHWIVPLDIPATKRKDGHA